MKFVRCIASLMLIMWSVMPLSGCWDQREIEERTSVVAIGIDASEENPGHINVTMQIPIPIKIAGSSGGGGTGDPLKIISASGRTPSEAFSNLQKQVNQQLFYGHTRIIALGEELARSGVGELMDVFRRDPQIRRLLWPLVVKGKAADLMKAKPQLEQLPSVFIMSMIENGVNIEQIPDMNLGKFYIGLSSAVEQPFLNYLDVKGNNIYWKGAAVFKEDKMVGVLNERETWNFMRLKERKNGGIIVFEYEDDPRKLISFRPEMSSVDERYKMKNGHLKVEINILLEGDLVEKTFSGDFSKQAEIRQLERDAERYLKRETEGMIRTLQHNYNTDVLGIGENVRAFYPKLWKQVKDTNYFSEAEIAVTYDIELRRTGMEMQ